MEKQPIEQPEESVVPITTTLQGDPITPTCSAGYYWNATLGECVLDVG